MPLIASTALAAATLIAHCPWPDRGFKPYMGDVPSAVDTYTDIPKATREALKAKMRARAYDEVAHITGAGVSSAQWHYGPLTMMHFGDGRTICRTVDTSMWPATDPGERALIYCADGHCVAVPTVCRNVSRIARLRPVTPPPTTPQPTPGPDTTPSGTGPGLRMGPLTVTFPPIDAQADISAPLPQDTQRRSFADDATPQDTAPPRISAGQSFYDLWARPPLWPLAWYAARVVPAAGVAPGPVVWLLPQVLPAPPVVKDSLTPEPPAVFPIAPMVPPVVVPAPGMPAAEVPDIPAAAPTKPGSGAAPVDLPDGDVAAPVAPVAPVPEPTTWALMMGGLAWAAWVTRRRNVRSNLTKGAAND